MRIGSVVLLQRGVCVQSIHWSLFRPLGGLQTVMDELEQFGCDEVTIIRPVRKVDAFPDFQSDIAVLRSLKTMTPVAFGGGIRSVKHLDALAGVPIERLVLSSAFVNRDERLVEQAIRRFGRQSIQCLLPILRTGDRLQLLNCDTGGQLALSDLDFDFIDAFANEVIVYDCANEGARQRCDLSLIDAIPIDNARLVLSGGVGHGTSAQALDHRIASILIDNKTLHAEYSIERYRHG